MVTEPRDALCYVLSPSYSGSTLLTFLLNTHPQIATIGELKARTDQDVGVPKWCSCGEPMKRCPFWQRVAEDFDRRSLPFDITDFGSHFGSHRSFLAQRFLRARIRGEPFEKLRDWALQNLPGPRAELARVQNRNRLLVETICRLQGGSVFLDSSKDPIRLKLMLHSGFWNVRILHLVRDGRATANSFINRKGISMKKAALAWRRPHEQLQRILSAEQTSVPCLRVHYEELATQPVETLKKIFTFLHLEGEPDLNFRAVDHHILGNLMRLENSNDIVLDKRWQQQLTPANLETFERFGGALNRQLSIHPRMQSADQSQLEPMRDSPQ